MIERELRSIIVEKYNSVKEFAQLAGIPYTTLDSILKRGVEKANVHNIIRLCQALDLDVDALAAGKIEKKRHNMTALITTEEQQHIKKYRALDEFGQGTVNLILDREYSRCTAPVKEIKPDSEDLIDILEYLTPVSAGTGVPLDGTGEYEHIKVISNMYTRKADYCLTVKGNSMEPKFYDGDKLLVHETDDIEYGEIGIFIVDGQGYVKKKGEYQLISLNDRVPNVYIDPFNEYRCVGLVVGTLDPDWMR